MKDGRQLDRWSNQAGVTLIEVMLAVLILTIVSAGLLAVFSIAVQQNKSQGEYATRVTEYAQDKMEQLLALQFTDAASNTTVWPTATAGGTGLSPGGSTTTATAGYVDYLDVNGNLLGGGPPAPANAFYIREWQITQSGTVDTITVSATTLSAVSTSTGAPAGTSPTSTLVCLKADF